ncbi:uncharacterized protein LOC115235386 [Formica exsecta]|uniref:uncharacterized protein LOC115235386 n=1 Tax=Formica exsecta TaxID=72781 RepID=UPI0011418560|nr:uncharacterized protein LOC115235386 [Formica exsecta]
MVCGQFKAKPVNERRSFVEAHRLCYNCLGSHPVARCQSTRKCWSCKGRHHSMFHDAYATSKTTDATALSAIKPSDDRKAILLATARVLVADRYGEPHSVRVLIDQGSEVSIITESLAQRLHLPRNHSSVTIFEIGGSLSGASRGKVALKVTSRVTGETCSVVAFVLPRLSSYRSSTPQKRKGWPHLQGLPLADPEFMATDPVELLLGAEICSAIFKDGIRKGGPQAPMAQNTILGWILSGGCSVATLHGHLNSLQCTADYDLTTMVRRFWEQEEVPLAPTALAPEEERCNNFFVQTHTRTSDGRYVVRLPFATTPGNLEETRKPAERLLTAMERKGSRDSRFGDLYRSFMLQYEQLKHMSEINKGSTATDTDNRICYLPLHGVLRESSITTKLSVVFNGSQRIRSGESLNSQLLVGANLLPALADVLRWRWHRYAIVADIEKMYRQILVHPDDRDFQRVLWRRDNTREVQEYRLNTVTYGLACAPFLAIRTLRQLADDEESRFPLGAAALRRDCYDDDIVSGANTTSEAATLQHELRGLCMAGGFPLRKWASNYEETLTGVPQDHRLLKTQHT